MTSDANDALVDIHPTRNGFRLSQHGVVISELRTKPGPTHSVFDFLAALIQGLPVSGRVGVMGFAGGGMMAPLVRLGFERTLETVDLDAESYDFFRRHCPGWSGLVDWTHADAEHWLRGQRRPFGLLVEDLSEPWENDVKKPDLCWGVLPGLIQQHLAPEGIAVFNLLKPKSERWEPELIGLARNFKEARLLLLDDFENRILVAGRSLPTARALRTLLRDSLGTLGSRQKDRFRVRTLPL